jgi:hypothetical protein
LYDVMDAAVARPVKGFTTPRFHHRCHGCTNIVPLILDTKGNVFGGFTPASWRSLALGRKRGTRKGQ